MKRTLVLRRENLTALSADDLAVVAGGAPEEPPSHSQYCLTIPTRCVSLLCP